MNLVPILILLLALTACSDSGSSKTVKPDSAGEEFLPFVLPVGDDPLGSYQLVNAYPELSFSAPVYASGIPGEDRLLVLEQSGLIKVFENNPMVSVAETVLDIRDRVLFAGEQGLLGLAFDPAFQQNRLIYLHYSKENESDSDIANSSIVSMVWDTTSDRINKESQRTILEIEQPFGNHNGGMLEFGPDDFLYIALGDGGSGGDPLDHGQNLATLLGSLLRIDVHPVDESLPYSIPADNPFLDVENARPEIYAYGLRNPFRFSFDRETGDLWLGDVGQDAREEINLIEKGGNYGWRVFEGNAEFTSSNFTPDNAQFEAPVLEYGHSEGVSVIGGYVYRGNEISSLVGKYLYTDFISGSVWALERGENNTVRSSVIATASNPTSFGETESGELLIVSRSGGLFKLIETAEPASVQGSLLSETGLFEDLATLAPAMNMIEYEPNHSFWSDGAEKQRWFVLPDQGKIAFGPDDWLLPTGAIAVKHFEIAVNANDTSIKKRLETRVLANTVEGWQGFTYRWNATETDAELISARESETLMITDADQTTRQQLYSYPGRSDCLQCHTDVAGTTLGLSTPQLNGQVTRAGDTINQLIHLDGIEVFDQAIGSIEQYSIRSSPDDVDSEVSTRARDYLDVNCAYCHQPGGPTGTLIDLRASTPDDAMNVIDVSPLAGNLNVADSRIVAAGDRDRSVLWLRMQHPSGARMPPLGSNRVNREGVELVGQWIDLL